MTTEDTIREIIARVSGKPVAVGASESLLDSGVLDSFALVAVVSGLEEQFGVKIPDSDLSPRKFSSIARIREYLQQVE